MNYTIKINYEFITDEGNDPQLTAYVSLCNREQDKMSGPVCFGKKAGSVIGIEGSATAWEFNSDKNNLYELLQLQLPPDLLIKLSAYIMKTKISIIDPMKENPLILTGAEAEIIELKKKELHVKKLIREYNLSSRTGFQNLPSEAQTVLFSLTYQYGIDKLKSTLRDVWLAALNQDWALIHELLEQAGAYVSRRKNEAELIRKIIPK